MIIEYSNNHKFPVTTDAFLYFLEDYELCRAAVLDEINYAAYFYGRVQINSCSIPDFNGNRLLIDYSYFCPSDETINLIILVSGVHGIEGFVGSAVQRMFLREIIPHLDIKKTGCLIIHSVNPWGMKYYRRVTANNVDLNRNFDSSQSLFSNFNSGYAKLNNLLNPAKKVNKTNSQFGFFFFCALCNLIRYQTYSVRQAFLEGQYSFPKGIYFGGENFEHNKEILQNIILKKSKNYRKVLFIDIHTGYGPWGKLQVFGTRTSNRVYKDCSQLVFRNEKVDLPDKKHFFSNRGDLGVLISDIIKEKIVIPVCFEYGTMKNETYLGLLKSLHTVVLENQGFHYGYTDNSIKKKVLKLYRELFYPYSLKWKSEIIRQSRITLLNSCCNLETLS